MPRLRITKSKTQNKSATLMQSSGLITILRKDAQNVSEALALFRIRMI